MLIKLDRFSGIAPRTTPRLLNNELAQTANNCKLLQSDLMPWRIPLALAPLGLKTAGGTVLSIYRWGQNLTDELTYWLNWLTDVDVCKGAIAGDVDERTYWTGDGTTADTAVPKMSYNGLIIAGAPYPSASYNLGVPAPTAAMTLTGNTGGSGVAVDRAYVFTFVTALGEEGRPSPALTVTSVLPDATVTLGITVTPPSGTNSTGMVKRIYRSLVGSAATKYQLVAEISLATASYADAIADTALSTILPSNGYSVPVTGLRGLVTLPNGFMAGFFGKDLWFSEPFLPHAWPQMYRKTLDFDIVALAVSGQSIVAATNGSPYVISGAHPSSMSALKLAFPYGCVSKRSIATVNGNAIYASADGLVSVGQSGTGIVTLPLMTRDQWQAYVPSSIIAFSWNGYYVGFYNTGTVTGGFIFNPSLETPALVKIDTYATAGYVDPKSGALYLMVAGVLVKFDNGASLMSYTWKSKVFRLPKPSNMGAAQVLAASYPVTLKLYGDGTLKHTQTVADNKGFALPAGYTARDVEVEITGTATVQEVLVASTQGELANG